MSDLLPPNYVACSDGHGPVFHRDDIDCPACKAISKKLTDVNDRDIKIAVLTEALKFYAEGDYYYDCEVQSEAGEKAQAALTKLGIPYASRD